MQEIEEGVAQVEETQLKDTTPKGRAGVLAMWHTQNPKAGREPLDDELWELAQTNFETKNRQRKNLIGANVGLSEVAQRDPKFGSTTKFEEFLFRTYNLASLNKKRINYKIY